MELEKYKREIVLFALMVLLCLASFGIGYLVAGESERATIMIDRSTDSL